jgi:hypothetical protein
MLRPHTLNALPRTTRAIAGFVAEYARTYASDRLCPLVGGFVMLRLFNPSLITPEAMGLLGPGVVPTKTARRNLTLISKILQNLSNGLMFGSKEEYMTCMNPLIDKYTADFKTFLLNVAHDDLSEGTLSWLDVRNVTPLPLEIEHLDEKHVAALHGWLIQYRGRLLEYLNQEITGAGGVSSLEAYSEEEEVFQLLDELPQPTVVRKDKGSQVGDG